MILAAGFGRRMLSLTDKIPKPLVRINNISLLKNCIDFLFKIGCKKIVINTHYKHELVSDFINKYYKDSNIFISCEKDILDTGGGVKNAISFFDEENILVTNSDIYWTKKNELDVIKIISDFNVKDQCRLLLVTKKNANGINNKYGDFSFQNNLIRRWQDNDKILYYSGLQMIFLDILKNINTDKFSFNAVWDYQIEKKSLHGNVMTSNLYHVGDFEGFNKAVKANT